MSNRLADLEQTLAPRAPARSKPNKQQKMRSALDRMQQPQPTPQAPSTPPVGQGLSARVSRWPGRGRHAARSFSAISYDVPGNFWVMAQPSGMTCWATVFTMLKSWRSQRQLTIEQALATVGERWVNIFRANGGLAGDDKPTFISTSGLVAEPPQSYSLEGWEGLLRNYGPVWVTTDEAPGEPWAIHARIITGIHGDGTPENTKFKIVDPAGGRRYEESIAVFIPKYEEEVRRTGYMRIQVVHWQADAVSEQRAMSYGRSLPAPSRSFSAPAAFGHSRAFDYTDALAAHRQAMAMNQSFDVRYNVQLVPQQTGFSCWAAGFAMIVGWREQMSIDPSEIARAVGYWSQYQNGLHPEDLRVMNVWGFTPEAPQSYMIEAFVDLLRNYGPLWIATAEPGPHIRVVTGIHGDGTPDGTILHINDPWEQGMSSFRPSNRGSQYTETYRQFEQKQATLAGQEMSYKAPIYIAHLPSLPDWMRNPAAQSFSAYVGHSIAMEAPSNPANYRLLTSGTWNSNTSLRVQGGQGMWFKIRNANVLGTTITITDQAGQTKQSIILPASSVEFVFAIFGSEPMGWRFDISTNSDAFIVTWELWSTWVPGMPPNG
ncbi:papain-like cysteine protease family protein [Hahella sp. NBU794]|uniref:papain-like cysteine protease family protein n=1 Tax=Hahella sp. NBU794 TaxID=3422590 RepID=UPI003D6E67D6